MDDYHIKIQEIQELREAVKLKRTNEQLMEQLVSSLRWLLHYSQKHNIPLPEMDKIAALIDRTLALVEQFPDMPTTRQQPFKTPEDSTEPIS